MAILQQRDGRWTIQGDPTEGALLVAARKIGLDRAALDARFQRIGEVPFSMSYAEKRTTVFGTDHTHRGTAFYGSASYTNESFGVSFEYKDYRFGITGPGPDGRENRMSAKRALAFQNAPRSLDWRIRASHVVDPPAWFGEPRGAERTPAP